MRTYRVTDMPPQDATRWYECGTCGCMVRDRALHDKACRAPEAAPAAEAPSGDATVTVPADADPRQVQPVAPTTQVRQ